MSEENKTENCCGQIDKWQVKAFKCCDFDMNSISSCCGNMKNQEKEKEKE